MDIPTTPPTTPPAAPSTVIVNLNVNVDAQGTINIFSAELAPITNEVVATTGLPVADLYTAPTDPADPYTDAGLFRFQQTDEAVNDYVAEVVSTYAPAVADLSTDLHACLQGGLVVDEAAEPFTTYPATYRNYGTMGDMALAVAAHHLFGHVQATAAIDNDLAFVGYMNNNAGTLAVPGADIAKTLATRIMDSVTHMNADNAYDVVKQVLGQDASRATLQDNTDGAVDTINKWQHLQWRAGDIVYIQVTLKTPNVSYGVAEANQQYQPPALGSAQEYDIQYYIKITLE